MALQDVCLLFGPLEHVKVIRDKASGESAGYAFVRFEDRVSAQAALGALRGQPWLGKELRLNWAFQCAPKDDACHQFNIFVGDLAQDVTDAALYHAFRDTGCCQARVLWDHDTGRSKRYGVVSYRSRGEGDLAIAVMQGQYIGLSRVRCRWAQHKQQDPAGALPDAVSVDRADSSNTNVYIGNVSQHWTDLDLCNHFSAYGPLAEARLHKKGGYAFVRFEEHSAAVAAVVATQGATVAGQVLKCSWGKTVSARSQQSIQAVANAPYFTNHTSGTPDAATLLSQMGYTPAGAGMSPWSTGGGMCTGTQGPWLSGLPMNRPALEPWVAAGAIVQHQRGWGATGLSAGEAMVHIPLTGQAWQMSGEHQRQQQQHHHHQQYEQQQVLLPLQRVMWGSGSDQGGGRGGSNEVTHFWDGAGGVMMGYQQHDGIQLSRYG